MKVNTDGVANSYLFVCAEGIRFDTDSPLIKRLHALSSSPWLWREVVYSLCTLG